MTTIWRRVRDSNPRSLSTYSISSAAPSTTRTTLRLCDSVQFKKLFARTDGKNNKIFSFRTSPKRSAYGRSKRSILPNLSGISSAAPSTTRTTLRLCDSVQFKKLFARTDGKNNKIFSFRTSPKRSAYGRSKRSILPNPSGISSHVRYDHFDTSPCSTKIVYQTRAFVNDFMLKCFV